MLPFQNFARLFVTAFHFPVFVQCYLRSTGTNSQNYILWNVFLSLRCTESLMNNRCRIRLIAECRASYFHRCIPGFQRRKY